MSNTIKAIDKQSVHRICSGQVVVSLAVAVKELIENAIDAGATLIEIKLKNYGLEVMEVSDNGLGVAPANYESLTLKHHTSKISDFDDLAVIESFGFRGEALSSLCALGKMSVTTRMADQTSGTKIVYDADGHIVSQTPAPRGTGTTVVIEQLFSRMPVRYQQLQKNIKREFAKLLQMIQAYCIISTNIRIICTNQPLRGSRQQMVSTGNNKNVLTNLINVFGAKQGREVSPIEIKAADPSGEEAILKIEGLISNVLPVSCGRSSADRQFFYVNGRPCDLVKVAKAVNESYRSFNAHKYPVVILNIIAQRANCDVNVTPDKRTVYLHEEKSILALIKSTLDGMYEPSRNTYAVQTTLKNVYQPVRPVLLSPADAKDAVLPISHEATAATTKQDSTDKRESVNGQRNIERTSENSIRVRTEQLARKAIIVDANDVEYIVSSEESADLNTESESGSDMDSRSEDGDWSAGEGKTVHGDKNRSQWKRGADAALSDGDDILELCDEILDSGEYDNRGENGRSKKERHGSKRKVDSGLDLNDIPVLSGGLARAREDSEMRREHKKSKHSDRDRSKKLVRVGPAVAISGRGLRTEKPDTPVDDRESTRRERQRQEDGGPGKVEDVTIGLDHFEDEDDALDLQPSRDVVVALEDDADAQSDAYLGETDDLLVEGGLQEYVEHTVEFDLGALSTSLHSVYRAERTAEAAKKNEDGTQKTLKGKFKAKIAPGENTAAEAELERQITKEDFVKMEVLGQFNLGFIIARLRNDLFIIDQHATDEIYNFETLQTTTKLQSQPMVVPKLLELTAPQESILLDELPIFEKNGFRFTVDQSEGAMIGRRVRLSAVPNSKNTVFGVSDVEEMIHTLSDTPGVLCRPTKVRKMFAMRACRKSIMIGTALKKRKMKEMLVHMGEINLPWNCPHGRPTMRHLHTLTEDS